MPSERAIVGPTDGGGGGVIWPSYSAGGSRFIAQRFPRKPWSPPHRHGANGDSPNYAPAPRQNLDSTGRRHAAGDGGAVRLRAGLSPVAGDWPHPAPPFLFPSLYAMRGATPPARNTTGVLHERDRHSWRVAKRVGEERSDEAILRRFPVAALLSPNPRFFQTPTSPRNRCTNWKARCAWMPRSAASVDW